MPVDRAGGHRRPTQLGDGVVLAGQAGVAGHLRLASGAQVAAKSAVFKDVAEGAQVAGIPAVEAATWRRQQALVARLEEMRRRVGRSSDWPGRVRRRPPNQRRVRDRAASRAGRAVDHVGAAAPLSVPAGRPRARDRARQADRRDQERHHQRAVLRRPLPRPAGDAGRAAASRPWRRRAASCCCTTCPTATHKLLYFTGIERARFRRPVVPGDQVRYEVEVLRLRAAFCKLARQGPGRRRAGGRGGALVGDGGRAERGR